MASLRDAIVAAVTRAQGRGTVESSGPSWQSVRYTGGYPFRARPDGVEFLREREAGSLGVAVVRFEDVEGRSWEYAIGAMRQPGGDWKIQGGSGGSGRHPERPGPWANLGGWGWPRFLVLAGRVYGDDVHLVRVAAAGGEVAEDVVAEGVALLLIDAPAQPPCAVTLHDAEGNVLRTQSWPRGPGRSPLT